MKKTASLFTLLTFVMLLAGCAGTDFKRPADGDLTLGKSTPAEVTAKMGGDPMQTGELLKNEKQLKVFRYAYASTGGESTYPDVTPARSISYTFFNDILTSKEFVSSFKEDSSDFDAGKIPSIAKGKTTRKEIVALFGKPTGEAIYPVIKIPGDRAYVYGYTHVKGAPFNMQLYTKLLIVSFNKSDVVTDVEYATSGQP